MKRTQIIDSEIENRARELFRERQQFVYKRTDRMFAVLLICQWLASIGIAAWISPRTWAGHYSDVHIHLWTALFLGGLIIVWPVGLAMTRPGETVTRHIIAIAQMFYSALLIHLTGGRIETHFHVFGSLAFLSFYRDWRVLISATVVVAGDHCLRGLFFPQSVYGVATIEPWRWLEHAWWVVFEDCFLIGVCRWNVQEMQMVARRQAEVEQINSNIEKLVSLRTEDLNKAKATLTVQYAVAHAASEAITLNEAINKVLEAIGFNMLYNQGHIWGAFWSDPTHMGTLQCANSLQIPEGCLQKFADFSKDFKFDIGKGLPGRVFAQRKLAHIQDISQDNNLPRLPVALEYGLTSAFAFPVIDKNAVLGVIEFFTEKSYQLPEDAIALLEALGRQIGQLIVYKKTEAERERLASIVQHSKDAIFTKTSDGIVTTWNQGAEHLFGYTSMEVLGQHVSTLRPPERQEEIQELSARLSKGEHIDNYESEMLTKDGTHIDVSVTWAPIFDETGKHGGHSVTIRDIRERKAADKRVSEFYSIVSHELRTPLTSIRGVLGLIEANVVEAGSDEAKDLLGVARGSADRLIRLINDMLDLRKVESGKMELKRAKIIVKELVSESLYALTGMAQEASVKLVHESQADACIYADWDKVTQVITNLVSNAIKFSPVDSQISIRTRVDEKCVRFDVIDQGPGISAENIAKLFQKFQQVDSSDTRQKGGTGLGLAIAKALVEQHDGSIGVESTPGNGSKFWFELPVFAEQQVAEPAPHAHSSMTRVATPDGELLRVLLIEDDDGLAAVLKTFLESQNYKVIRKSTLSDARMCLAEMIPDVVVLDLTLPDGNGLDLIENLRTRAETLPIPVIVITGQQREEQLSGNGTIVDWLCKPFDGEQLIKAIDRALGPLGSFKVLVVDDDIDTRKVITTQLRGMGLQCIEAKDGAEAISFARSESPDLIVLDVLMPKVNGYQVVETLKEEARTTPLLIYTCSDLSVADRQLLTLGVTEHLTKGASSQSDLARVVHHLLTEVSTSRVPQVAQQSHPSDSSDQEQILCQEGKLIGPTAG